MLRLRRAILLLFAIASINAYSKESEAIRYRVEMSSTFSGGDYSPFYLTANRHGLSSTKNCWGVMRGGVQYSKELKKGWSIESGLDIAAMYNTSADFVIQQAYADIKYKRLFLSVGAKEHEPQIINPLLSSGDLIEGINSRPVPRIKAGIESYTAVPMTNRWVKIKGYMSFGWFTDSQWQKAFVNKGGYYTKNVIQHRKEIFLKFGKIEKFPIDLEVGFNHAAQFGGSLWRKGESEAIQKMPHDFSDYLRILCAKSGGKRSNMSDQINAIGNHLGSWNLALRFKLNTMMIKAYYQHMYEDGSGMFFGYGAWRDGLTGLSLKMNKKGWIDEVAVEYLNSKRQTASMQNEGWSGIPTVIMGKDNYYNNGDFLAWQHHGMAIGNPLLTSPIYNSGHQISFLNNRVDGYHIAVTGTPIPCLNYRAMVTMTNNYGTYQTPFDNKEKQFNSMLELSYSPTCMKGWTFTGAVAYDKGKVTGENVGGMISVKKVGIINFNCNKKR